ncbi:hypothetical protein PAXINDRAFT_61885, partial [Paxillus involutus ATCC 200175]
VIRILLEHGADAKFLVDDGSHTTLAMGFRSSYGLEIARLLLEAGCDPTTLNNHGISAFHSAIQGGNLEFVQWLIEQGFQPPPDAILHLRVTLLQTAVMNGHVTIARLLLDRGAQLQVQ